MHRAKLPYPSVGALTLVFCLAGCMSPGSRVRTAAGEIRASADVAAPARLDTARTVETITLPAGSVIESVCLSAAGNDIHAAGRGAPAVEVNPEAKPVRVVLSAPAEWRREISTQRAATATGHLPPSPAEIARGTGVRAFWLAGLACLLVAGLLAWRAHWLAALCAAGAGIALPVIAAAVSSAAAVPIGAAMLAAAGAFFVAWHLLKGRVSSPA